MKRILIATDGSKASDAALEEGTELARELEAAVMFVYVTPYPPALLGEPYYQRKLTQETADAREAIEQATAVAGDHGVEADWEIFEGEPAEEILHAAKEWDVDLIVIGSRGLGAVAGTLLGSVSRAVVHRAGRPVLVARSRARRRAHAAA
jgi:nucleotide-binding universal stress UspA family protein